MSSLRKYDSDTSVYYYTDYTDKHSFNISESDNVSQTHSTTKDTTLEDHRSPRDTEIYTMVLEGDRLHRWFGSYPYHLEGSLIRLQLEYWYELIGFYDEYKPCTLDLETAKDFCLKKILSDDTARTHAHNYYSEELGYLNRLETIIIKD